MKKKIRNIELRSNEVVEILTEPPRWIIRGGITVILIVLLGITSGSYFFRYPDILNSKVTILSENPSIPVVSENNGELEVLFKKDHEFVREGEMIAIIKSPANYADVFELMKCLDSVKLFLKAPSQIKYPKLSKTLTLGPIQDAFNNFEITRNEYERFFLFDQWGEKINSYKNNIKGYKNFLKLKTEQFNILRQDIRINAKMLQRDSVLHAGKAIPDSEIERSRSQYYKQLYSYKNSQSDLANTQIQINQLEHQILETNIQRADTESKLLANHKQSVESLIMQISAWEKKHVLKSAITGEISFSNIFSKNQYVTSGMTAFTIVPQKETRIIGRILLPISGSGKVKAGQRVNIKLDSYPYVEFGILTATIENISAVPIDTKEGNFYVAIASFPDGLTTTHKKEILFQQEMQGSSEIITNNRRLLERMISPLVAMFDTHTN